MAALAWGCAGLGELGGSERPNLILILTDDQRWDQLGVEGHPFLDTPHLDRLAREGARFANMFVTTSLCSPSRASFLSGLYASTHGVVNNFTDYPADLPSFPRRLQETGYHTAYIGKYRRLYGHIEIGYPDSAFDLQGKPGWVEERLDTWHGIYGPIYGFREKFPDRSPASALEWDRFVTSYTSTIKSVDDSVGVLYQTLEELEQLDNTVLLFAGDNGMFLGEHGMTDKRAMHEPSIRVPLLARYPERIQPGTVIREQVLNVDVAPSIIELAGADPLADIHGRSWVSLLGGDTRAGEAAGTTNTTTRSSFPTRPTSVASGPIAGSTSVTLTATAAPTATSTSCTTWRRTLEN